jgi:hypothetical protein
MAKTPTNNEELFQAVGRIEGTVSSFESRIAVLENGKVGWRAFSSIQAFFLAAAASAVTFFGYNK